MPIFHVAVTHRAGEAAQRFLRSGVDIVDVAEDAKRTWPAVAACAVRKAERSELCQDVLPTAQSLGGGGDIWLQLCEGAAVAARVAA